MAFTLLPISAFAAPIDDFNKLSVFLDRLTGNGDYPPITDEYIAPFAYAHGNAIAAATDSSEYSARTVKKEASPDLGGFAINGTVDWNKVFFHLFRNNDPSPNWDAKFYSSDYYKTGFSGNTTWDSDKRPNPSYHGEQFNGGLSALVSTVAAALGTNTVWHTTKPAVSIIPAVPAVRPIIISVLNGFDNSGNLAAAVISYLQKNNDLTTMSADVAKEVQGNITALKNIFGLFSSEVSNHTSTPVIAFGTDDGAIDITPVAELLLGRDVSAIDGNALSDALKTLSNLLTAINAKKSTDLEKLIGTPAFLKLVLDLGALGLDLPAELTTKLKEKLTGSLSAEQWIALFDGLAVLLTDESASDTGAQTYALQSSAAPQPQLMFMPAAAPSAASVFKYTAPKKLSDIDFRKIFSLIDSMSNDEAPLTLGGISGALEEGVKLIGLLSNNAIISGVLENVLELSEEQSAADALTELVVDVVVSAAPSELSELLEELEIASFDNLKTVSEFITTVASVGTDIVIGADFNIGSLLNWESLKALLKDNYNIVEWQAYAAAFAAKAKNKLNNYAAAIRDDQVDVGDILEESAIILNALKGAVLYVGGADGLNVFDNEDIEAVNAVFARILPWLKLNVKNQLEPWRTDTEPTYNSTWLYANTTDAEGNLDIWGAFGNVQDTLGGKLTAKLTSMLSSGGVLDGLVDESDEA
ncbi:MAG: hypothetical protein LBK23_05765, partial [Oscillospiraceae bacterium]|nr:hypothetical protein [Oscillospiraceae bacterium]